MSVSVPIEIIEEPPKEQLIKKGDIVELTVAATSDRLYPVSYKWIFKNKTYEGPNAPPHVQYDALTLKAYINTTDLTDEEMREIKGLYRREVFHQIQTRVVDVMVTLENEPVGKMFSAILDGSGMFLGTSGVDVAALTLFLLM